MPHDPHAPGGERALLAPQHRDDLAADQAGDLILLDLMMPGLDGWRFLEVYRKAPGPKAPVLIITAARTVGRAAEDELGAAVIHKPFSLDTVLTLVRRHLELV